MPLGPQSPVWVLSWAEGSKIFSRVSGVLLILLCKDTPPHTQGSWCAAPVLERLVARELSPEKVPLEQRV